MHFRNMAFAPESELKKQENGGTGCDDVGGAGDPLVVACHELLRQQAALVDEIIASPAPADADMVLPMSHCWWQVPRQGCVQETAFFKVLTLRKRGQKTGQKTDL